MPVTDTDDRYPHYGTCDVCAIGDRPLREFDPESEAWICAECDERHERGIAAAAKAMNTTRSAAAEGIAAYLGFDRRREDVPVTDTDDRRFADLQAMDVDDFIHKLRGMAEAYPEDVFIPLPERSVVDDGITAHIMRRLAVPWITLAADRLEDLAAQLAAARPRVQAAVDWFDCPDGGGSSEIADDLRAWLAGTTEPADNEEPLNGEYCSECSMFIEGKTTHHKGWCSYWLAGTTEPADEGAPVEAS